MKRINIIRELSESFGPSGFEDDVLKVIQKYKGNLTFSRDKLMNAYLGLDNIQKSRKTIMLDAHTDEVGFMIQSIDEKGLMSFVTLGGWIPYNIPAHIVQIKNREGKLIKGITTSKPPHFMSEEERNSKLKLSDIQIDVGASSRDEVLNDYKIDVAAPVAPYAEFEYTDFNKTMRGKAFDNRLGCAAVLEVMERLDQNNLNVNVVGAFAAQEEAGMRGAEVTARRVKPDLAITFEGSPADDTCRSLSMAQAALGRGPQLRHRDSGYISNHRLNRYAGEAAAELNMSLQNAVRAAGKTNAAKIHLTGEGVPTLVLGIPSRYVHTHYGFASLYDFQATVELAVHIIRGLDTTLIEAI